MNNEDFISWFDKGVRENKFTVQKYRSADREIDGMQYASGAFKKCFVFENEPFVLKFPFDFCPFTKQDEYKRERNACEDEIEIYNKALEAGVEKILLKTEFIGYSKGGTPLYIQPKITTTMNDCSKLLKKKYDRITKTVTDEMCDKVKDGMYYHSTSNIWVKMLIVIYGKKFALQFEKFSRSIQLGDLHHANIGFLGNNPVILDYNYCGDCH